MPINIVSTVNPGIVSGTAMCFDYITDAKNIVSTVNPGIVSGTAMFYDYITDANKHSQYCQSWNRIRDCNVF
jgi:hypothetical protein